MKLYLTDIKYGELEITNGILFFTFKKGLKINLQIATELVEKRLEITQGKTFPALIDAGGVLTIDKQARDYFGSAKGEEELRAGAFLCKSFYTTILANFFLNLTASRRKIPAKLFRDKNKALLWLEKYKEVGFLLFLA